MRSSDRDLRSSEKKTMSKHLIFFDDECPFCHHSVCHILQIDREKRFLFAPLQGETARFILIGPQAPLRKAQSLILVENYQSTAREFYTRSRALFRIYWHAGRWWACLGALSFLPCWLGDTLYQWLAAHRHQFRLKMPQEPGPKERFLP